MAVVGVRVMFVKRVRTASLVFILCISISVTLIGCGESVNNLAPNLASNGTIQFPTIPNPNVVNGNTPGGQGPTQQSGLTQALWNTIRGQWRGNLEANSLVQPFTLTLTEEPYGGQTYAFMSLVSKGPIGNITVNAYLPYMGPTLGTSANVGGFQFGTQRMEVPQLKAEDIAIEFIPMFTLTQGGLVLFPSQSQMNIWECPLSLPVCTNLLADPSFKGLEKVSVSP